MDKKIQPIGFLDSGVGGLSVLRQAVKMMPNENYVYFGDSKNAPYGTKSVEEVKELTFDSVDFLLKKNIKALVVACNTATSVAINDLRHRYNMPIIGIEPALKPAVELKNRGKIVIMATPMTLKEKKFSELMEKYKEKVDIVSMPCPKLVEYIENGITEGKEINNYLREKFKDYDEKELGAIVLGCTHYPFIKKELSKIFKDVDIIDGSVGTVKQLKRKLLKSNIENDEINKGKVEVYNSMEDEDIIKLSYKLLNY